MHAFAVTAHAPEARFKSSNHWGVPVVPTRFQPGSPCGPGQDCCDDCSQAPAEYLARDIEARPRIPSAFRRGMQGLGVSSNAYMQPFVPGSWEPQAAARRLPGTGPEESRPEGFHGLGAANITIAASDPRIVAASDFLARSGFGNAELNAAGLHRYQVVSSAAHILQTLSFGGFDRDMLNQYRDSVCRVDDAGNVIPGSGDVARGRAVVSAILGGAGAIAGQIGGSAGNSVRDALNLVKNQIGELENEIRERCEIVSAARRGGDMSALAREYFARHPPTLPVGYGTSATGMSTGVKVAIGAVGLGLVGALVYAIAK